MCAASRPRRPSSRCGAHRPSRCFDEWIASGADALIVTARAEFLDETWLGRPLRREICCRSLRRLGVDPCGERGEYHTVVTNSPLFSAPASAAPRRAACAVWVLRRGPGSRRWPIVLERRAMLHAVERLVRLPRRRPAGRGRRVAADRAAASWSASSARTDRARRRCSSCSAARCAASRASVAFDGRPLADWTRREHRAAHRVRSAGDARAVRLHRARHRADGPVSAPRHLRARRARRISPSRSRRSPRPARRRSRTRPFAHAERRREAARRHRQRAGAEPRAAAARRADGVARPRPPARGAAAAARG